MARGDTFRDELRQDGYSQEEKYFYDLNRELIDERRRQLDARRAERQQKEQQASHWMKCPKCGGRMSTSNLFNILVEQCALCKGVYLDRDEIETVLKSKKSRSFLARLFRKVFDVREASQDLF